MSELEPIPLLMIAVHPVQTDGIRTRMTASRRLRVAER